MNRLTILALGVLVIWFNVGPASAFLSVRTRCPPFSEDPEPGLQCTSKIGMEVNCTESQEVGSEAKCKTHYLSRHGDISRCSLNGNWTLPNLDCQIDCGRLSNSKDVHRPFHAVILQAVKFNQTVKICSGSLISEALILTTRHCLVGVKGNVLEPLELFLQLGRNDGKVKPALLPVHQLYFLPTSTPNTSANATDLAIIRLEQNVELSSDVVPICLPSCEQMDVIALRNGSIGEVLLEGKKAEEFLINISEECSLHNMVCAGKASGSTSLCQEETGLGITVPMFDSIHFLHGVLSNEYWTSCKSLRPFKRVFPYVDWIRSVMDFSAEPYSPSPSHLIDENDVHETVLLRPRFQCTDSPAPNNKDWFHEIPPGKQSKIINLPIYDKKVSSCDLLNSLRLARNLNTLNLTYVTLTTGFQQKVTLPELTSYTLETMDKFIPLTFADYFPFTTKDGRSWNTADVANLDVEINISNGIDFVLDPARGYLEIGKVNIVDEVLRGISPDRKWNQISLTKVNFSVDSIPDSLRGLSLYEPSITGGTLNDVLKKVKKLEFLDISYDSTKVIKTSDLPVDTLVQLIIGKVNLTNSAKAFFGEGPATFKKLDTLFISSLDTVFDQNTREGFADIFKTVRRVGYFGKDDFPLMSTILNLKKLEELTMRVLGKKTDVDVKAFFDKFENFDLDEVPYALDTVIVKFTKSKDGYWDISTTEPLPEALQEAAQQFRRQ